MSRRTPLLVAHRGASGLAPENTLVAFKLAIELGVDGIELDVHMSKDGKILAMHDSTVDRTTDGKGRVAAMKWDRLRELDAGSWFNRAHPERARPVYVGERIPALEEVLSITSNRHLFIEIKDPDLYPDHLESELLSLVRRHERKDQVTFLSFSRRSLRKMKALDASVRTGLLISRRRGDPCRAALDLKADGLAVLYKMLDQDFVRRIRDSGLELSTWTVDSPEDIQKALDARVDAIITNHPEVARASFPK